MDGGLSLLHRAKDLLFVGQGCRALVSLCGGSTGYALGFGSSGSLAMASAIRRASSLVR